MKYLVELVFGIGSFGLAMLALTFFLRFLLLTWAVRLAGRIIQSILGFARRLCHAVIFIFCPALLGGSIIGLVLQSATNLTAGGGDARADPTQPVLFGFLGFFVIIAVRTWQWNFRKGVSRAQLPKLKADKASAPCDEMLAHAWARAVKLAPMHRHELLEAEFVCSALLNAVDLSEGEANCTMIETAELIRGYLAPFVGSVERRLSRASWSDKKAIVKEMVEYLMAFARRAQRDMGTSSLRAGDGDSALRAHLQSQLFV